MQCNGNGVNERVEELAISAAVSPIRRFFAYIPSSHFLKLSFSAPAGYHQSGSAGISPNEIHGGCYLRRHRAALLLSLHDSFIFTQTSVDLKLLTQFQRRRAVDEV
jgi:hypothetical protein